MIKMLVRLLDWRPAATKMEEEIDDHRLVVDVGSMESLAMWEEGGTRQ